MDEKKLIYANILKKYNKDISSKIEEIIDLQNQMVNLTEEITDLKTKLANAKITKDNSQEIKEMEMK